MPSDGVIEPVDVSGDGVFSLLAGLPGDWPDQLRLDGLEERLDHRVVVRGPPKGRVPARARLTGTTPARTASGRAAQSMTARRAWKAAGSERKEEIASRFAADPSGKMTDPSAITTIRSGLTRIRTAFSAIPSAMPALNLAARDAAGRQSLRGAGGISPTQQPASA